jgi:cation diffusion facilitator family transporter
VFKITNWLLRLFIKDYKNINKASVRNAVGRFASWTGILLNLLLVAAKIVIGLLAGSLALIADGLNNLMDASGSIITLAGFKIAAKKADKEHPFGHGRYEYISGFVVAILVLAVGIEIGENGIKRILNPEPTHFGPALFIVLVLSILLKLWMAGFYQGLGRRIGSTALKAVSADCRNDTLATGAVLISSIVSRFMEINLDGWTGLGVAAFIIYNGISLIKETLSPLLGEAPSSELIEYIAEKILSYDNVLGIHDIIVHDYGPNLRYVSAHVEMPSNEDVLITHGIIDKIEKSFLEDDGIHMIIHHDPIHPDDDLLL